MVHSFLNKASMAINFHKGAFIREFSFSHEKQKKELSKLDGIPTSDNITGIEVRLSKAYIIDNKTPKVLIFPGYAKIYLLTIVISDAKHSTPVLNLKSFAKVADHESLPVDASIFYWKEQNGTKQSPSQIHTLISIIKSKEDLKNVGEVMSNVQEDEDFIKLSESLGNLIKNAARLNIVTSLLLDISTVLGRFLGNVDDKPLLTWVQSFTDINGDFDVLGKTTTSRKNKWAEANLSIIVRDKEREAAVAKQYNFPLDDVE